LQCTRDKEDEELRATHTYESGGKKNGTKLCRVIEAYEVRLS